MLIRADNDGDFFTIQRKNYTEHKRKNQIN